MKDYWKKGDQAPGKGTPFRHTRDRALLLLEGASEAQLRKALKALVTTHPGQVLDALCTATDPDMTEKEEK
jgi:hypothetical protein